MFEIAVVNVPSVFEPSKFQCIWRICGPFWNFSFICSSLKTLSTVKVFRHKLISVKSMFMFDIDLQMRHLSYKIHVFSCDLDLLENIKSPKFFSVTHTQQHMTKSKLFYDSFLSCALEVYFNLIMSSS